MGAAARGARDEDVYVPNFYDLGGNSVDGWAEHVLERVDGDIIAIGASLGGYVALAMARAAPDRVKSLLLAGARATADPPERRAAREEMIRVVQAEGIEGWNREFAPPGPEDRTTDELVRGIQALRDRRDATDVVAGFTGPLTVVVGDRDEILPVDEARQIASRRRTPGSRSSKARATSSTSTRPTASTRSCGRS